MMTQISDFVVDVHVKGISEHVAMLKCRYFVNLPGFALQICALLALSGKSSEEL